MFLSGDMKVTDVLQCSFQSWYGAFSNVTIESVILAIPKDVLDYLMADGIFIDSELPHGHENTDENRSRSGSTGDRPAHSSLNSVFKNEVNTAISNLGGETFPKLNWSSPKDAAWITPMHSLKCTNAEDVFLLLKSSDFVVHDLTEPFLECEDRAASPVEYVLVLRRWMDVEKSNEFRCFVNETGLIAISQRHADSYFSTLAENGERQSQVTKSLLSFFADKIKGRFPSQKYVFDAYLDGDTPILLDFNPFGIVTDSLLFDWQELQRASVSPSTNPDPSKIINGQLIPELRVIKDATIRPVDPYAGLHGVPLEYHRLAMEVAESGKQPVDALLEMMNDQNLSDDDDDETEDMQ